MRPIEEIKRGLECCEPEKSNCYECPYYAECEFAFGGTATQDALAYIRQLEQELDKVRLSFAQQTAEVAKHDCDMLVAVQKTIEKLPRWISVEERLPEKGQKVMVCGLKGGMQVGAFRGLLGERRNAWDWKKHMPLTVTHWMPLPEPPEEDADEDH